MTDLTSTLSSILVETHRSNAIVHHTQRTLDSFLIEAKQINKSICDLLAYVRAIRQPFLSTAPPPRRTHKHARVPSSTKTALGDVPAYITDDQRKNISDSTSSLLRGCDNSITNLRQAANLRHETAQRRLEKKYGKSTNFLFRWAAGGQDARTDAGKSEAQIAEERSETTTHQFRENVLYYLGFWLKQATVNFQHIVGTWSERLEEKKASTLYDAKNRNVRLERSSESEFGNIDTRGRDNYNPALDMNGDTGGQIELTEEQMQLFEEENSSLMNHYNEMLTQVTQAEKSLIEISSLQQTLIGHLTVQGEMIGELVADAERTDENVQRGNKELKRATERTSTAKIMYHSTLWICAGLVVWDLIF